MLTMIAKIKTTTRRGKRFGIPYGILVKCAIKKGTVTLLNDIFHGGVESTNLF